MVDRCVIDRPGTTPVTDDLGHVTYPAARVYDGRCKVQTYEGYEQAAESAGATITVQRYRVDLPVTTFLPQPDDVVTITASQADPALPGKRYRITAPFAKSLATARRCFVDEIVPEVT